MLPQYPSVEVQVKQQMKLATMKQQGMVSRTPLPGISNPVRVRLGNPALMNNSIPPPPESNKLFTKKSFEDIVNEIDPNLVIDEDLQEHLMLVMDDFVDEAVSSACTLAAHRESNTLEVKDMKLHLERLHNIYVPGFGGDDSQQKENFKATEAHKQRMALLKKSNKK